MNTMLSDDDLTRLLGAAAASFAVPDPVLEEPAPAKPLLKRRSVRLLGAAAAVAAIVIAIQSAGVGVNSAKQSTVAGSPASADVSGAAAGTTNGGLADPTYGAMPSTPNVQTYSDQKTVQGTSSALDAVAAPALPVPQKAPATQGIPSVAAPDAFDDSARIVKTGTIGLVVADGKVSSVVGKVRGIATTVGGYVASEKSEEYGDDPTSTLTLRVPVSTFERTMTAVRNEVNKGIGKVDTSSSSGQDITAQYSDIQAQIQSLTATRNRFLVILSRANTIGETLSVQERVDSTQLQIDRLEGQRRLLQKQSDLATVTVTVSEKPKSVAAAKAQSGLSKSWDNAKDGFTSGVESLISHSGRALLVLIVGALGLLVLRSGYRLARRRLV
jgi:hypothetical protein